MTKPNRILRIKGRLFELGKPLVMGILNVTPDSFHDGGQFLETSAAVKQAEKMLAQGADIIDIGGMSSRPGAAVVEAEEEQKRIMDVIEGIANTFPSALISVDTVYGSTARKAVQAGACMVNDISAGSIDAEMFPTIADLQVPYVLMHMKGLPQNMQNAPTYEDPCLEVIDFLQERLRMLRLLGVADVLIDPGFGFGKSVKDNFEILQRLNELQILECPLLLGISRKSMIYKTLETDAAHALNGTSALHMAALMKGAEILRVHDVAEAVEVVKLFAALQ